MMIMAQRKRLFFLLPVLAVFCSASVFADEPEGYVVECYEGNATIFMSEVADISEFDAASFGVTLQNTISIPEKNAVLYQYGPTDIMCVVVSE